MHGDVKRQLDVLVCYPGRYKLKLPFYHHELGRRRHQAAGKAWSHRAIASNKNRDMSSLKLASPTKECVLGTPWPSNLPKDEPQEMHCFLQVLNSLSFFMNSHLSPTALKIRPGHTHTLNTLFFLSLSFCKCAMIFLSLLKSLMRNNVAQKYLLARD